MLSFIGLILLSPILCIISLFLLFSIGQPVLFKQLRPGLNGIPINFYKFRTMTNKKNKDGHLLPDGERLTALGKFLRKQV